MNVQWHRRNNKPITLSRRLCLGVFTLLAVMVPWQGAAIARAGNLITAGNARFTVITSSLIRIEFDAAHHFIDNRSYFAIHRHFRPVKFKVFRTNHALRIITSRLRLAWLGAQQLTDNDLRIAFRDGSRWKTWHPGLKQTGNLGGTRLSLDECQGPEPLGDGVLSRDGWYLLNDQTPLMNNGPHPWIRPRPKQGETDWYFFGYRQRGRRGIDSNLILRIDRIPNVLSGLDPAVKICGTIWKLFLWRQRDI